MPTSLDDSSLQPEQPQPLATEAKPVRQVKKRPRKDSDQEDAPEEAFGFGKLWGRVLDDPEHPAEISRIITAPFPITLGRLSASSQDSSASFVDLGSSKFISRNAAVLAFVPSSGSYTLSPIGKNKVWIGGQLVEEGQTVGLKW